MDAVAELDQDERSALFRETAAQMGVTETVVEKDFWVCWTLEKIFGLSDDHPPMLFKGGTSLSKVFDLIDRFSEDIDITIDRVGLGLTRPEDDPRGTSSSRERQRRLERLKEKTSAYVVDSLLPGLRKSFVDLVGEHGGAWTLSLDATDPQCLIFSYPQTAGPLIGYLTRQVKIELGARGDQTPADEWSIHPYALDHFPGYFESGRCTVRVLHPRRTFWEKVTLLHALHHGGAEKASHGLSRHYYDVTKLANSWVKDDALADLQLLKDVKEHKMVFFGSAWARYGEALPGSLRIAPGEELAEVLAEDYGAMQEMFFEEPPPFAVIVDGLRRLEEEINGLA